MSLWTPLRLKKMMMTLVLLCCFAVTMHLFSNPCTFLSCGGLLLNAIFNFSIARCIRRAGFAIIRVSYRCVIDVMLLHCTWSINCTWLIRTLIIVSSGIFHLLLSEFDIAELRLQLIHLNLKYQGVERLNLQGASCRHRLVCRMTFPTLCLTPKRWMGLKEQSIVAWLLPELYFSVFRGAGACGVANAIYKQFRFSHLDLCCWFY